MGELDAPHRIGPPGIAPTPPPGGGGGGIIAWDPLDPVALVAMLTAFYPIVSASELARARRERPEYFAGGELFGSKGDKLRTPAGRVYDLIFAAGGPPGTQRWICLDVTAQGGGDEDTFALTPGPLTFLDPFAFIPEVAAAGFEAFVAGELAALDGAHGVLDGAGRAILEFDGAGDLEDASARQLDPAIAAHANIRAALDADDPIDELAAATEHGAVPEREAQAYVEEPPPDLPGDDPGAPPGPGGEDGDGPPPKGGDV